jgi:AraC-like DNA-binding protein
VETLIQTVSLLTLAFAATSAVFLVRHEHGERLAHRVLAFLLFVMVLEQINFLVHSYQLTHDYPFLANSFNNLGILLGTSLYFYSKTMTDCRFRLKWEHWPHLIPPILVLLYNLLFYHTLSTKEQLSLLVGEGQQLLWLRYVWTVVVLGHICILGYLLASLKVLKHNGIRLRRVLSDVEPYSFRWLGGVVGVFLLIWLLRISKIPLNAAGQTAAVEFMAFLHLTMSLLGIALLMYKAMRQHPVFTAQLAELAELPEENDEAGVVADLAKIQTVMQQRQLWRQPSLTLAELAEAVSMDAKEVSSALNDDLKKNFFEFVNELRCQDVAAQLRNTDNGILEIAFFVGFNSKTAFNRAFKRHFNQTPSHYRKS